MCQGYSIWAFPQSTLLSENCSSCMSSTITFLHVGQICLVHTGCLKLAIINSYFSRIMRQKCSISGYLRLRKSLKKISLGHPPYVETKEIIFFTKMYYRIRKIGLVTPSVQSLTPAKYNFCGLCEIHLWLKIL